MTQEERFHQAMLDIYDQAKDVDYYATRFQQMVRAQGGVQAAKQLLSSLLPGDGFATLWELDRLDISVEALVLKEEWRNLFIDDELAVARQRLEDCDYKG